MQSAKELVRTSLQKTNAHGLARLVNERLVYTRVLWLLAWLICCGAFLRQFAGFVTRLREADVMTNFQSNAVEFQFPDLYFCYDSPMSGSRHLAMNESAIGIVNATFESATRLMDSLCEELSNNECDYMYENELPMMKINSLPYRFLVDQLGQTLQQSILNASIVRSSGIVSRYQTLKLMEFYHPSHLRCFKVLLSDTERTELQLAGPTKSLYFQLMLDAADSRMGTASLPRLNTPVGNLTAPYWALDKETLYWPDKWSAARLYITEPGHYPSTFDTTISLEAGRSYNIQLKMSEQVHKDDPSRCTDQHPDVQIVNPYDNSPYTVAYDYAYCYNSAVQAQFKRALNVTCGFLPHPWPPSDRLLYNLSSGWGSLEEARILLSSMERLALDEAHKKCESAPMCVERIYSAAVSSVLWPSMDSLMNFLRDLDFPSEADQHKLPAFSYLKRLVSGPNASIERAGEFVRANFLQLQVIVRSTAGDRTIFIQSYSFESFVADVGGILGIYLGMSVLTAWEIMQFLHDIVRLCVSNRKRGEERATRGDEQSKRARFCSATEPKPVVFEAKELPDES